MRKKETSRIIPRWVNVLVTWVRGKDYTLNFGHIKFELSGISKGQG